MRIRRSRSRSAPASTWKKSRRAQDEERQTLGVLDEVREIDGVTTAMMVALGKEDIKSVEDFAGCATDDLVGWTEKVDGEVQALSGRPQRFRPVARRGRGDDHGRPQSRPAGSRLRTSRSRRTARKWLETEGAEGAEAAEGDAERV